MADFLLELLSEEIPARMQEKACADLARLFAAEIGKAGLKAEAIETFATPRRLALIARGLPLATEAVAEEIKGPRADAPAQALAGFLGKTGLTREQLVERMDAKGHTILFAVIERFGRATADVLAEAIPAVIRAFPWPKSMRWGAASASTASLRWVRPLQGIVALLGDEPVPFEVDGIVAGAATLGHRFHHPGPITIGNADDYAAKLRACHVVLDPAERRAIIAEGAAKAAAARGLSVVPDEGLIAENAGLTEWPVPLLGAFDPAFLAVPREVIQLTMRTNQKYFALVDDAGALAPAFICTANVDAHDGGASIIAGNQKVLAARLADAKFFWEQDLKVPLATWAGKLDRIVFHEKLGTVADKVDRVAKLARWLVEEGIVKSSPERGGGPLAAGEGWRGGAASASPVENPLHQPAAGPPPRAGEDLDRAALAEMAEQAARLCKADLVTGMVGEFPELQGVMGGYYARAEGLPDAVADAIRDHYKPVGQGDEVPTAPVTVAVSLADKLDTLLGFYSRGERPSGSKDPFALRRAALSIISLILNNKLRIAFSELTDWVGLYFVYDGVVEDVNFDVKYLFGRLSLRDRNFVSELRNGKRVFLHGNDVLYETEELEEPDLAEIVWQGYDDFMAFIFDRLKFQQREEGVRHDVIEAVISLTQRTYDSSETDLVRLLARVYALQAFVATNNGANLLAGYKRAANILKAEEKKGVIPAQAGSRLEAGSSRQMDSRLRGNDDGGVRAGGDPPAILSDASEEGIPQTGEEDPLVMVEDPGFAEAVAALDARMADTRLPYAPEPAEAALIAALDAAEPRAAEAVAAEDFAGAMAALSTLRGPIDAFFEAVTVNDPNPDKRAARLALLDRIRGAVHNVADFSKIEG